MKINLFGYGFVGKAHHDLIRSGCIVNIIDPVYEDLEKKNFDYEASIICVSTPERDDGTCDMSNVFDVISTLDENKPILIKSTISLEGWRELKSLYPNHSINFSPEFLRAGSYLNDIQNQTYMYLSEDQPDYWANFFNHFYNEIKFIIASAEQLILVKYFRNSFLATKVSFFNQVYDLCEATNIDFEEVRAGITFDSRIGISHSDVTPARGFGGHCFEKDTSAIVKTAELFDVDLSILKDARRYNKIIRRRK